MDDKLVIQQKGHGMKGKIVGVMWIFIAFYALISNRASLETSHWILFFMFLTGGIAFFTSFLGSPQIIVEKKEGSLKIRWKEDFRRINIPDIEIEKIVLAEKGIKILRKGKRAVKILLYNSDNEEKQRVYDFFTAYAQLKNFV